MFYLIPYWVIFFKESGILQTFWQNSRFLRQINQITVQDIFVLLRFGSREHLEEPIHLVQPVLSSHSNRKTKIGFQDLLSVNAGQKYCKMLQGEHSAILRPSLSSHLSFRPSFCLFLSVYF